VEVGLFDKILVTRAESYLFHN